ncbi:MULTISPECIES: type II toxin-antitoxin system PemK/MazF family toxin [unclassified Veillonella]|uniref:type II toxin-antitoxin system PemK/MazF family toxin n=1 Tax=unclassified Veillonella TaxID=2630086 RepID=UPI00138A352B|nr:MULTISPECIES: type II toxin-antitoxin system PemK/MazF family toxin [unclassified Veillonella]KAF1682218.1 hypothetical protein VER_06720 [Veillonella sp. R32]
MDLKNKNNLYALINAIKNLSKRQESYLINETQYNHHRAAILYYGMNDTLSKIKNEHIFHKNKQFTEYKRGMILKINFGLPVGSEFGGDHYAIVLRDSKRNNPLVSVLPLKSFKGKFHNSDIIFNSEIYDAIKAHLTIFKSIKRHKLKIFHRDLNANNKKIQTLFQLAKEEGFAYSEKSFDLLNALFYGSDKLHNLLAFKSSTFRQQLSSDLSKIEEYMLNIEKLNLESTKFKSQSIGIISQVRTISKMRVKFSATIYDPLYGIKLSSNTMKNIDKKLISYYTTTKVH